MLTTAISKQHAKRIIETLMVPIAKSTGHISRAVGFIPKVEET